MRIELEDPNRKKDAIDKLVDGLEPVKNEKRTFKSEIAKMKSLGRKAGFQYFLDYYKWPVIIVIIAVIAVISIVHSVRMNSRPWIMELSIYNNAVDDDSSLDALSREFAEAEGLSLKDYQILFSADSYYNPDQMSEQQIATVTKFSAQIAAQELDIIGGNRTFLDDYGYGQEDSVYFADLQEVLPDAVFNRLNADGRIYWSKYTDEDGNVTGKYAAAINIENSRLTNEGGLLITPSYIGIAVNTQRLDTAVDFIIWNFGLEDLDTRSSDGGHTAIEAAGGSEAAENPLTGSETAADNASGSGS